MKTIDRLNLNGVEYIIQDSTIQTDIKELKDEVDAELAKKADTATTYTKSEVDAELAKKANTADTYTKTATDEKIADFTYDKATIDQKIEDSGTFDPTLYYKKSETYSKTEVDTELAEKNQVITLDGTTLVIS